MPPHGRVTWLTSASNQRIMTSNIRNGGAGHLKVSVPSSAETYYVKLKEVSPGSGEVLGAFVGPGRTLTIDVPLNGNHTTTYALNYAAGTSWYGPEKAFGPSGMYARADETFAFDAGSGWEVELILQPGGNLGTTGLDYADF